MPSKFQRAPRPALSVIPPAGTPETDRLFGLSGTLPRLVEADVARITPNPDQPRTVFDDGSLRSLADNIDKKGLLQPILVKTTEAPGDYMLVAGERRWRAFQLLGRTTIPAIITEGRAEEIALIENVQRVDLDAVDLARNVKHLMNTHGYRMLDIGAMLGCAEAEVSRRLSVLRLPSDILDDYRRNPSRVSRSAMAELATLDDPDRIRALWRQAVQGLTVKELRVEKKKTAPYALAAKPLTAHAVGKSLAKLTQDLARLEEARPVLKDEHRDHLRAIRTRIDAMLDE